MKRWPRILAQLTAWCAAACFGAACIATPLPVPPTADPDGITIVDRGDGSVGIEGDEGALSPSPADYRVTWEPPETSIALPARAVLTTAADGSFAPISLPGARSDRFYVELLTADDDVFVIAITGGPDERAIETAPSVDRDGDGSPDFVDCAPTDPALVGQRCP